MAALLSVAAAPTLAADDLRIRRITPAGEDVPAGRQVVITFDRAVVPIGRMERRADEVPVTIDPAPACQWRWLDPSNLACQLGDGEGLRAATRYTITVAPGLTAAQDGARMSEPVRHAFVTVRPKVQWVGFDTWRGPSWPVMRAMFDQPVTRESVVAHLSLRRDLDGAPRQPVVVSPVAGAERGPSRAWLLQPSGRLDLDTGYRLEVEPGLRSALGPEPGIGDRVVVVFHTFPELAFAGVRCNDIERDEWVLIPAGQPFAEQPRCDPLSTAGLAFTAPVIAEEVKAHLRLSPDLAGGRTDYDPWANRGGYSRLGQAHTPGEHYVVWLPERLKAFDRYRVQFEQGGLADEFGRRIGAVDMDFMTAHRRPRLVLDHPRAVLESGVDSEVPVYVTNLDRLEARFARETADDGVERSREHVIEVPAVEDVSFALPFEVRDMLDGDSGAVAGRLTSSPPTERAREFFAQVTPFQVHVKLGHFSSLAWVTSLATGEPVAGAEVAIYVDSYAAFQGMREAQTQRTDADGVVRLPGTVVLDPQLKLFGGWDFDDPKLFVRVERDGDLAVLPLDGDFRAWSRGVWASPSYKHGHMRAWGTTAQGVYRAGDTIQYKLYVREQSDPGFVAPPREGYSLEVHDPQGQIVHRIEALTLSEFGAHDGAFEVPATGAVGWYRFQLTAKFSSTTWQPLRVLVSDFTPSPFKVSTELAGDAFGPGDEVVTSTLARLHAGGPYVEAATRITARLRALPFRSDHPLAQGFYFGSSTGHRSGYQLVHQGDGQLDDRGELETTFTLGDLGILFGRLQVESAVRDDRGKFVARTAGAAYLGRDRFVGLRNTRWLYREGEPATVRYLVAAPDGTPAAGAEVVITVERRVTRASRVKGAGNAFLTRYEHEWVPVASCEGVSDTMSASDCEFTPPAPGSYRVIGRVSDTRGREHVTQIGAWVAGKGRVVWEQPADGSLELIPEKTSYAVGETARYLVRNPYPGARALITVERYGVLEARVQTLDTTTPVIEVPVEPDHVPGFYLSVVVVSPRVDQPLGPSKVDLGKPALRMGYLAVQVDDPYKQMDVTVRPARERYKPRETVRVELEAKPLHGASDEPVELAVAVLDEAVFDLISAGRGYFDPYRGFYSLGNLDVLNYSLLTRLVGRQKFEKKGASTGGDGGGGLDLRSLFMFVSYWNPSIRADDDGRATVEFEVPDNLTGWRVLAMAVTPGDRFGLGDAGFKVNKPTEIRPVMPNQVLEGDRFDAGFSVMNRTDSARVVEVQIDATGPLGPGVTMHRETISLAPFKRRTVWLPLGTRGDGEVTLVARARDAIDGDAVRHVVPVGRRRSLETAASYGSTTEDQATELVEVPAGAHDDAGGVSVVASPSVIGNVDGAFRYMRSYPYACWEQVLSKGVMASHYAGLRDHLPADLEWPEAAELPARTLARAASFQAPNGGMAYWVPVDRRVSPYLSAYTALAFTWLSDAGHAVPAEVEQRLHGYLERMLRKDVMPDFYTRGMASTVRAVALAALAARGGLQAGDLERHAPHIPYMSLFGKAWFHDAARRVPGAEALARRTLDAILAHGSFSGGKVQLNEAVDGAEQRILTTPVRAGCATLMSLAEMVRTGDGEAAVGDLPMRMVRALTQTRGNRAHWENTQENVFCMNALVEYARAYESEVPDMRVEVMLDGESLGETAFSAFRDLPVTLERPMREGDPGARRTLRIAREGAGRLYYSARVTFASREDAAVRANAGIDLRREYSVQRGGRWQLLESPMRVRRGELVRVDLYASLPTARHFVVIDDPVPGGLEPVNRDLATASTVDADEGAYQAAGGSWWHHYDDWRGYGRHWWSFYHQELRHDAARFFSDYLPPGNYHVSYTAQVIAEGEFSVMPAKAEEMYDPDVFGRGLPATLLVGPAE